MKNFSSFVYNCCLEKKGFIFKFLYPYFLKRNPIVEAEVNDQNIKIPFSHMLPFYQKQFEKYDKQLGNIAKIIFNKKGKIDVIDVGANIGDTIINIGLKEGGYLAVEGEKRFFDLLKYNTKDYDAFYENIFLTDSTDKKYKSVVAHGTAKIIKDDNSEITIMTMDELMETRYNNFKADLIKIDTDGFDFKVIRGARNYISVVKPSIYFEWSKEDLSIQGEDELSIFYDLQRMGYENIILFDNFGNKILSLHTNDIEILKQMSNYTTNKDKRIYYYDIFAFHKDSVLSLNDFRNL